MASRRIIYRDYRSGSAGRFVSKETFNRSQGQGVKCQIHREYITVNVIRSVDDLYDIQDEPDLDWEEFHATGDTGE